MSNLLSKVHDPDQIKKRIRFVRKSAGPLRHLSFVAYFAIFAGAPIFARDIHWVHLTSKNGNLPIPGKSPEQTGLLVARLDQPGPATDFVLSFRVMPPALV